MSYKMDYGKLKAMLDEGMEVPVLIRTHPFPCYKTGVIARKDGDAYSLGYGFVYDYPSFLRQCFELELEMIDNEKRDMMDYEKPYKDSLERAKQFSEHPYLEDSGKVVEYIFPELRKKKDDVIRQEIVDFICMATTSEQREKSNSWLAWLDEQKTSDEALEYLMQNHSPSDVSDFQAAMNIAVAKAYDAGVKKGMKWNERE